MPQALSDSIIFQELVARVALLEAGGATGNASELNSHNGAFYLARANHTGTQPASTISDFASAVAAVATTGGRLYTKYLTSFDSITQAVTAINIAGTPKARLIIDEAYTSDIDESTPENILVEFQGGGFLTPTDGATYTIGKMVDAGDVRIFNVDDGNVVFAKDAVPCFRTAWYCATDSVTDATRAVNNIITSITTNTGGVCYVSSQHTTDGGHIQPDNSRFVGNGFFTGFKLNTASANNFIFKTVASSSTANFRNINAENMTLDGNNKTGAKCLYISGLSKSVFNIGTKKLRCINATYGVEINSEAGGLEVIGVVLDEPHFENCTKNISVNTINNGIRIVKPYSNLTGAQTFLHIESCGIVTIDNHYVVGSTVGSSNGTFIYSVGAHWGITVRGGQDEGVENWYDSANNYYPEGLIRITDGCIIQSAIWFRDGANTTIRSVGNHIVSGAFKCDSTATGKLYSEGDSLYNRDIYTNAANSSPRLDDFGSNTGVTIMEQDHINPATGDRYSRGFKHFRLPASYVGATQTDQNNGATFGQKTTLLNYYKAAVNFESTGDQPYYRRGIITVVSGVEYFDGEVLWRDGATGDSMSEINQPGVARRFCNPVKFGVNGSAIDTLRHGTAILASGTVTVTDALITANSRIRVDRFTDGGTVAASYSYTRNQTSGVYTGFTITAKDGNGANQTADTSTVWYEIIEP